jgi:nitronate monooxygenase
MIRTRFTEMFGLEYPVMSAPMGAHHSGGALAAGVSAAGGLGSFGGQNLEGPEWVRAQVTLIRERTDRAFAVGFITPFLDMTRPFFDVALECRPDAIALSFSDPGDWGRRVKDVGCRLICQVQTFADVDLALAAGADVVVAQGNEAGGHTGTMGLLPLLCGVAERYPDIPLLAAGGIAEGRGLAAALLAGADGAWLGTAFLATTEAIEVRDALKSAIVASDGSDTVFTRTHDIAEGLPWPSGIGERIQRDAFTDEWTEREAELRRLVGEITPPPRLMYGQSARFVESVRPAADVLRGIGEGAERLLRQRPSAILD